MKIFIKKMERPPPEGRHDDYLWYPWKIYMLDSDGLGKLLGAQSNYQEARQARAMHIMRTDTTLSRLHKDMMSRHKPWKTWYIIKP